jgi:DNA-binding IclR family transcriptional regulator
MSREYINKVIETHDLSKKTEQTLSNADELIEELQCIEAQGYVIEDEERRVGI